MSRNLIIQTKWASAFLCASAGVTHMLDNHSTSEQHPQPGEILAFFLMHTCMCEHMCVCLFLCVHAVCAHAHENMHACMCLCLWAGG